MRKKALIVVDVQAGFLNERNRWIVPNIKKAILSGEYALIVEAVFHADPGSLWEKQVGWTFPLEPTVPEILEVLPTETITITKTAKSAFKGDTDLEKILKENEIEEVHIAGLDTEDCVFATAQESFDLGFFTYVLEGCTESSISPELREGALRILRELKMTDHS